MTNTFWGNIGFDNTSPRMEGLVSNSDHYQALPSQDGNHVLFIDPESHMLCMGSDASVGDRTLVRKLIFVPPAKTDVPRVYATCFHSTIGQRIVVGYGDEIMLYSVPCDVLKLSINEQQLGGLKMTDVMKAFAWLDWWQ
jgi:hypothetical protein